jgi:O-antigen/teichoic acid export membrane protein
MAAFEIALPVSKGLYPSYSKLVDNSVALVHAFLQGLSVTMAIVLPISGGLWALSNDIVHVVFGPKWSDAVWFLEWLAIFAAMECLCHFMSHQILIVTGHEKRAAIFMWVKLAIFSILLFTGFQLSGIEGIAIARPIGAGIAVILAIALLVRSIPVTTYQILMSLWRPLASVGLMLVVLANIENFISIDQKLLSLVFHAFIGAIIYSSGLIFFWMCSGRPPGLENYVLKLAKQRLSITRRSD